jgi:hypothetical protein
MSAGRKSITTFVFQVSEEDIIPDPTDGTELTQQQRDANWVTEQHNLAVQAHFEAGITPTGVDEDTGVDVLRFVGFGRRASNLPDPIFRITLDDSLSGSERRTRLEQLQSKLTSELLSAKQQRTRAKQALEHIKAQRYRRATQAVRSPAHEKLLAASPPPSSIAELAGQLARLSSPPPKRARAAPARKKGRGGRKVGKATKAGAAKKKVPLRAPRAKKTPSGSPEY